MADLGKPWGAGFENAGAGPFSRLARNQYVALATMRARIFANSFRTSAGAFELGARTVSYFMYCVLGLGLGVGAGAVAFSLVARNRWRDLSIECWIVCVLWLAISVALVSFQEQYDLTGLLQFPINFRSFFFLHLIFGLIDVSTIVGGLCCLGMLVAITLRRPDLFASTFAALVGFAVFNIFLVRAVLAWIDRWLAKRRSREIVSALFLLFLLSLQLLNPALRNPGHGPRHNHIGNPGIANSQPRELPPWAKMMDAVQAWLPPGLTAAVIQQSNQREPGVELESLSLLGAYVLGAAGILAVRLRAEYRGESLGEAPDRSRKEKAPSGWLISGRGPIAAEIEKDLRTLTRSTPQLYSVCVPMVMVFIIASLFRNGTSVALRPFHLSLPLCVAYGLLGFTQLMYNNLGGEGSGIQLLFLFPVPVRTILLAKNLFHAVLYAIVAIGSALLATLRIGRPDPVVVAATFAWVIFVLPANLAAGNILSLTMAYRVNLGRIGRQSGSQANALLGMLIQAVLLGIGAAVMTLCAMFDTMWIASPIFLGLACFSVLAWVLVLRHADEMANQRRDTLIARLAKIE
jgi:ABC-2 type transport system permease protein